MDDRDAPQTRWTLVRKAISAGDPGAFAAMSSLCEIYNRPLLAMIRSRGYGEGDAEDLRQRFFLHLLDKKRFEKALGKEVRLRVFLRQELKGYLRDHYYFTIAAKRDVRKQTSLETAGEHGGGDVVDWTTPDMEFDRRWRKMLVSRCLKALAQRWKQRFQEKADLMNFEDICPLLDQTSDESQRALADRLGVERSVIQKNLETMRRWLGKLIREEVAQTLLHPTEQAIREELGVLRLGR